MATKQKTYFLLKIKLMHTKIPVWRKFYVPADIQLRKLHIAIQIVMGWTNSHIHEFKFEGLTFIPNEVFEEDGGYGKSLPEGNLKLNTFISRKGDSFIYNYDMGDYWQHKITLENPDYKKEEENSALCIDGKGTCPPEDVGSVEGFEHFCEVINNPKDEEYLDLKKWAYEFCDYPNDMKWPDGFNISEVNKIFKSIFKPRKSKKKISSD